MPSRVQRQRTKGWRTPLCSCGCGKPAIYVGRPTKWGNPWHLGPDLTPFKPYRCGPEPDHHDHLDPPDARGWQTIHWIAGRESDCPECTEEVPDGER